MIIGRRMPPLYGPAKVYRCTVCVNVCSRATWYRADGESSVRYVGGGRLDKTSYKFASVNQFYAGSKLQRCTWWNTAESMFETRFGGLLTCLAEADSRQDSHEHPLPLFSDAHAVQETGRPTVLLAQIHAHYSISLFRTVNPLRIPALLL